MSSHGRLDVHPRTSGGLTMKLNHLDLQVSDVQRKNRGTMVHCYGPGDLLVEVSHR
jgi:hypothetical protein